jgi:hypothetical protein
MNNNIINLNQNNSKCNKSKSIINNQISPSEWRPLNFYKVIEEQTPELMEKQLPNPNYNFHHINIPFRMAIVGSSSSMKTVTVVNLLHLFPDTFSRIVLVCKMPNQSLYKYLQKHLNGLEVVVGLENCPDIDTEFDKSESSLVIFDDVALDKDQSMVENYAIRSRHMNVSFMYLSQDWFAIRPIIRKNLSHIILKHIPKQSDLNVIYKSCDAIDIDKVKFKKVYQYATKSDDPSDPNDKANFLMIDLNCPDKRNMYRKNISPINLDDIR